MPKLLHTADWQIGLKANHVAGQLLVSRLRLLEIQLVQPRGFRGLQAIACNLYVLAENLSQPRLQSHARTLAQP